MLSGFKIFAKQQNKSSNTFAAFIFNLITIVYSF